LLELVDIDLLHAVKVPGCDTWGLRRWVPETLRS
jgi:hypothetical protein